MDSYPSTMVFLQTYLSWIMNGISMIAAYCLSNKKAQLGRKLGMLSASLFILYGVVANQPAFIVADLIFLYIYTSAFLKFNQKRDFYREKSAQDEATIEEMENIIFKAFDIQKEISKTRRGNQSLFKRKRREKLNVELYDLLNMSVRQREEVND